MRKIKDDYYEDYELNRFNSEGHVIDYSGYFDFDEPRYDCSSNRHKWVWYEGFHVDRFWFCDICDQKNYKPKDSKDMR